MKLATALVACLLQLGSAAPARSAPAAGEAGEERIPLLAVLVAKTFLRAVVDRDLKTAAPLAASEVSFDGKLVKGPRQVRRRLARLLGALAGRRRLKKVVVVTMARARRLFGPPPARLKLTRKDLVVAFGRFRRGGLVAILAPVANRWRVIALTD